MERITYLISLVVYLVFIGIACGGSGGGSEVPQYAGAWQGTVRLVSNSCPREIPDEFEFISFRHNVNQGVSKDALGNLLLDVVLDDGIDTFVGIGQVDSDGNGNSFSTTGTPHLLPGFLEGFECREIIDFQYDVIEFEDDGFSSAFAGFVSRHSSISCTQRERILNCDVTYTGSADRIAGNT